MKSTFAFVAGIGAMLAACASPPPPAPPSQAVAVPPAPPTDASGGLRADGSAASAKKPSDESLTIDFPPAGAALTRVAQAQLDGAARLYRDASPEVMIVSGHTDKSGAEYDNLILSARRATMVKKGLIDRGVPADRLQVIALGEAEPTPSVVATRSVVVTWR